jgi:putative ABC transport system permease protein
MPNLLRRIWYIATGRRQEVDLAAEIAFHREMKAQELRDAGVSEPEIAAATQRALGNDLSARQQARDVRVWPWLQDISQDIRFGARMLAKDRRFTLAAVLALGLGIGVNNTVFTIINMALFRDLPFPDAHRLVDPVLMDSRGNGNVSYADYRAWSAAAKSFEGFGADTGGTMNLSDDRRPAERMRGSFMSATTFRLLRAKPIIGREFIAADEQPGAPSVTLLSYEVWQGRYGGDSSIVGHGVRVNGVPSTVIGVMPPRFAFPMTAQLWQPITASTGLSETNRRMRNLNVFGRLADGVSLEQARSELQTIAAQIAQDHPDTNKDLKVMLDTLKRGATGGRQAAVILATFMGAVGFVLLIACANVASLLLARSAHRAREIAIRASLGATRWRIVRQLLIECGLIALLASFLGLWLSIYGAREMATAFNVMEIGAPGAAVKPYWVDLSADTATWMFLGAAGLFASLAIGVVPSWHLSRTNVNDVLKDGGRAGSATVRARRMTGVLLISELALTVILLTGAGLMIRTYFSLYLTDLVLDTKGVVTMRVLLPTQKYAGRVEQQQFVDTLHERLRELPVFASVGLGSDIPFHPLGFASGALAIQGRDAVAGEEAPSVFRVTAGPGYVETLGMSIVRGRALTERDNLRGQEGALVNQRFAAKFFPDGEALGQRIQIRPPATAAAPSTPDPPWFTIVGVTQSLPNFMLDRRDEAIAYLPMRADPAQLRAVSIVVRSADPTAGKTAAAVTLREHVSAIDADLPVFAIQTLDEAAALARGPSRIVASWFIAIALVALILASVGLYALTAHGVTQRAQEIGVRMALGAQADQVVWLFVRRTLLQLVIGLALGIAGALAVGKLLSTFLRDTDPRDPITLALGSVLLVVVTLAASIWPARKAARVDPVVALRAD